MITNSDFNINKTIIAGHKIVLNYNTGNWQFDRHVDVPPWSGIYLKIQQLEQYVTTSFGLLIKKAS